MIHINSLVAEEITFKDAWMCHWQLQANPDTNSCIVGYNDAPPPNQFFDLSD